MAYIDKRTFEIYSFINESDEDSVFECDDAIAPAIRILNLKGYTTTYCCCGHPYPSKVELVSYLKSTKEVRSSYPGVYDITEVTLDDLKDSYHYDLAYILVNSCKKKKNKHLYLVKAIQSIGNSSYISFEPGKMPKALPKGWECDGDEISLTFKFKSAIKFFHKQAKAMEELVDWADSLPMYK